MIQELDMKKIVNAVMSYKRSIAALSGQFMDDTPDVPAHAFLLGLVEVYVGFYRQLEGGTREQMHVCLDTIWDMLDEANKETLQ